MSQSKRKLRIAELRLLLHKKLLKSDGDIKKAALLHVGRLTANGHIIKACDGRFISLLEYYYFPYMTFMVQHAPMCGKCLTKMHEECVPPFSNTGVNSNGGGPKDDTQ